ncbi:hypothetical protein Peur_025268 [Populus x canadensis]|uniref:uncharacterized protein At5g65660 n=1 Tax=Populus nigra TaxID=3691 RepID=UPI002B278FD6|nr:uncharacterized protein At5g65660 [Populus nigra]
MTSQDFSPPYVDASRPSLGFPLGAALLFISILSLSGVFSCCYHWDKLRSFRRRRSSSEHPDPGAYIETSPSKSKLFQMDLKQYHNQGMPVVMPGDDVPKFIALPCPCEPPRGSERVTIEVQKPPKAPPRLPLLVY